MMALRDGGPPVFVQLQRTLTSLPPKVDKNTLQFFVIS
jgi:hypothetical protein